MATESTPADKVSLATLAVVSFAILLWDHLELLPSEWGVYRYMYIQKNGFRDIRHWLFVLLRYTGIATLLINLFISSLKTDQCQLSSTLFRVFNIILVAALVSLVSFRITIFWKYHPDVVSVMGFLGVAVMATWIVVASQTSIITTRPTFPALGSTCSYTPFPPWFSVAYGLALAFFIAAFAFAASDILIKSHDPTLVHDIKKDSRLLTYLIVCIAGSAAVLVIFSLGPEQQINKQAAASFYVVIVVAMGSRIYLTFTQAELEVPLFKGLKKKPMQEAPYPGWSLGLSQDNGGGNGDWNEMRNVQNKPATPSVKTPSVGTSAEDIYSPGPFGPFNVINLGKGYPVPPRPPPVPQIGEAENFDDYPRAIGSPSLKSKASKEGFVSPGINAIPSPDQRVSPLSPQSSQIGITSPQTMTSATFSPIMFSEAQTPPVPTKKMRAQKQKSEYGTRGPGGRTKIFGAALKGPGNAIGSKKLEEARSGWMDS